MELKEYIRIFKRQAGVFWALVLVITLGAAVWQQNQPIRYQATLLLNIGRADVQTTEQYTYDSFYRLQADERFADTVVRWLGSPRIAADIYAASGLPSDHMGARDLGRVFGAKRLSSQVIEVTYAGTSEKTVSSLSVSVTTVLNRYAESLNRENREVSWFIVIGSDPVIRDARSPLALAVAVGLALGAFIGFWGALLRHYFFTYTGDAHRD